MAALALPYGFGRDGGTALAEGDAAMRMLIEQILFTMPGERVNRPSFGSLIAGLVFQGNNELVAAAAQATAQSALQTHLGDRIQIEAVEVVADEAVLRVTVAWRQRDSGDRSVARFERPLP